MREPCSCSKKKNANSWSAEGKVDRGGKNRQRGGENGPEVRGKNWEIIRRFQHKNERGTAEEGQGWKQVQTMTHGGEAP